MIIEIKLQGVVLLVLNIILTLLLGRWILGPYWYGFVIECRAMNPYLVAIILIFFRNLYALYSNTIKVFFPHLWNLALLSTFSVILYLVPDTKSLNVPNFLCATFFIVLSAYNPFMESIVYLRRKRYKQLCNRLKNSELRLFKIPCCIKSNASFNSYNTLTNSELESSLADEDRDMLHQETQTYENYETKCCQYSCSDSKHHMRGHIPLQLIGRPDITQITSCNHNLSKCTGETYCIMKHTSENNFNRNLDEPCKSRKASSIQYHAHSAGDGETPKTSQQRQMFITSLKAQVQKNLSFPETKQIRCERIPRKKENDVIKIEDLMTVENSQKFDNVPPFRPKPTDVHNEKVPKAVATALETIFVKGPPKFEELKSISEISTRFSETKHLRPWVHFLENIND